MHTVESGLCECMDEDITVNTANIITTSMSWPGENTLHPDASHTQSGNGVSKGKMSDWQIPDYKLNPTYNDESKMQTQTNKINKNKQMHVPPSLGDYHLRADSMKFRPHFLVLQGDPNAVRIIPFLWVVTVLFDDVTVDSMRRLTLYALRVDDVIR